RVAGPHDLLVEDGLGGVDVLVHERQQALLEFLAAVGKLEIHGLQLLVVVRCPAVRDVIPSALAHSRVSVFASRSADPVPSPWTYRAYAMRLTIRLIAWAASFGSSSGSARPRSCRREIACALRSTNAFARRSRSLRNSSSIWAT